MDPGEQRQVLSSSVHLGLTAASFGLPTVGSLLRGDRGGQTMYQQRRIVYALAEAAALLAVTLGAGGCREDGGSASASGGGQETTAQEPIAQEDDRPAHRGGHSSRSRECSGRPCHADVLRSHQRQQPALPGLAAGIRSLARACRRPGLSDRGDAAARDQNHRVAGSARRDTGLPVRRLPRRAYSRGGVRLLRPGRRRCGVVPGRGRLQLQGRRHRRHPRHLDCRQGRPRRR